MKKKLKGIARLSLQPLNRLKLLDTVEVIVLDFEDSRSYAFLNGGSDGGDSFGVLCGENEVGKYFGKEIPEEEIKFQNTPEEVEIEDTAGVITVRSVETGKVILEVGTVYERCSGLMCYRPENLKANSLDIE